MLLADPGVDAAAHAFGVWRRIVSRKEAFKNNLVEEKKSLAGFPDTVYWSGYREM